MNYFLYPTIQTIKFAFVSITAGIKSLNILLIILSLEPLLEMISVFFTENWSLSIRGNDFII